MSALVRAGDLRRTAASLLAVSLCATLQLVGPLHYLLVQHHHCAEHGELSHDDDHAHALVSAAVPVIEAPTGIPALQASDTGAEDSHEHCGLTTRERSHAVVAEACWMRIAAAAVQHPQPAPSQAWFVTDAPLDAAPKASPPSAA